MSARKPTAAAVKRVILAYEAQVMNPVVAWLREAGEEGDPIWVALHELHGNLRVLYDDVRQGLVDWEEGP